MSDRAFEVGAGACDVRRYFSRAQLLDDAFVACSRPTNFESFRGAPLCVAPPEAEAEVACSENLLSGSCRNRLQDDCRPVGVRRTLMPVRFFRVLSFFISSEFAGPGACMKADARGDGPSRRALKVAVWGRPRRGADAQPVEQRRIFGTCRSRNLRPWCAAAASSTCQFLLARPVPRPVSRRGRASLTTQG